MAGRMSAETKEGLKLLDQGWTLRAAAAEVGVEHSTLYRARKREAAKKAAEAAAATATPKAQTGQH